MSIVAQMTNYLNFKCFQTKFDMEFSNRFEIWIFLCLSLPWDRETAIGYFGEICFGTISGQPYFLLNGVILLLFISMCLYHRNFLEMFLRLLSKLDCPDKIQSDKQILCDLIRFHTQTKR